MEIVDDSAYSFRSVDNSITYDSVYGDDEHCSSKHGILIYEEERVRRTALVWAGAGSTAVHEHSAVISDAALFLCCSNKVFSLSLPELELRWANKADLACCFGVYDYGGDLIVHGELDVSRIDLDGNEKWSISFADITVTPDGRRSFQMTSDHIEVIDWLGNRYKVDYQTGESLMIESR